MATKIAFAGMAADSGIDRTESHIAATAVPFGVIVTTTHNIASVGGSGSGLAMHSHLTLNVGTYEQGDCVPVRVFGNAWAKVKAGEVLTVGQAVKFEATTGLLLAAATAGNTLKGAVVVKVDSGIAEIQINLPRTMA